MRLEFRVAGDMGTVVVVMVRVLGGRGGGAWSDRQR